ncbi:rano class II histocompatibility antigen, A beta chain-like [Hemitrygon akajei]|uniref:rano class II histocompatibility antigen, A beta chain-like n=1 Tax=Hemitrygon akajei TaxID=2704970 RepID=UPI003BF94547
MDLVTLGSELEAKLITLTCSAWMQESIIKAVVKAALKELISITRECLEHVANEEAADPTPLKIFAKWNSATTFIIVCETSAFYPKNFSLTWYKNGIEIALGIQTKVRKETEGLYVVSSNLTETQPVQNDTNYTCLVSHVSLNTSAVAVYSISKSNQGSSGKTFFSWVPGCAVGGLVLLLLIIVIGRWYRKQENKGKEKCFTEVNRREKTECATANYAAVDFRRFKNIPGRKGDREKIAFGQTVQDNSNDELSYATLILTGKKNRRKCKSNTEYAELQTHKQMGETEVVYSKVRSS